MIPYLQDLYSRFILFFSVLFRSIFLHSCMGNRKNIQGEICVSGFGSIKLDLERSGTPSLVLVKFKHPHHHHPCNPVHHHDQLSWSLQVGINNRPILVIEYGVGDHTREIVWEVLF